MRPIDRWRRLYKYAGIRVVVVIDVLYEWMSVHVCYIAWMIQVRIASQSTARVVAISRGERYT